MTPNTYREPTPPPVGHPLHATPEEAEAARQSRADLEAGLRERRERKEAAAAEAREARAKQLGYSDADTMRDRLRGRAAGIVAGRYSSGPR